MSTKKTLTELPVKYWDKVVGGINLEEVFNFNVTISIGHDDSLDDSVYDFVVTVNDYDYITGFINPYDDGIRIDVKI